MSVHAMTSLNLHIHRGRRHLLVEWGCVKCFECFVDYPASSKPSSVPSMWALITEAQMSAIIVSLVGTLRQLLVRLSSNAARLPFQHLDEPCWRGFLWVSCGSAPSVLSQLLNQVSRQYFWSKQRWLKDCASDCRAGRWDWSICQGLFS